MLISRTRLSVTGLLLTSLLAATPVTAQPEAPKQAVSATPWGVSSSASAFRDHAEWFPKMAQAGVTTVRLFPEWRGFEPTRGTWKWDDGDKLVLNAAANNLEISAILMGSAHGAKGGHTFPIDHLDDWSKYVAAVVERYKKHIHYWEVWNEGNGGFNDGKHTTSDYAKLAIATYAAVKKADPNAKVGLSVASFDAPYLNQVALALAKAGQPNSFDYLCIHPYEIADGINDVDGEVPFLWMTRLLRDALKSSAPERANAEIWITEIGHRIEKRNNHTITDQDAAKALAKIYTMAIAQGIARTQWFEARDPVGEDQGFGLLVRDGTPRASYKTLKLLAEMLGPKPDYVGWLALGKDQRGYGFVFEGKTGPVLIAWMPAKLKDKTVAFASDISTIDAVTVKTSSVKSGEPVELTDAPVLMTGLLAELVKDAKANAGKSFPWGGDFSAAKTVTCVPASSESGGIVPLHRDSYPTVKFADVTTGILVQGDITHPVSFYVHPSFAKFQTKEYYVRVTVRRVSEGNVGMNLIYEAADGQGRSPYKNSGEWYGAKKDDGWQTHTWHITDACFAKMWGYDFTLRPEQSVPYAIGKVEVSTERLE
jgi:polysaccharide biosynthesis protein PslG